MTLAQSWSITTTATYGRKAPTNDCTRNFRLHKSGKCSDFCATKPYFANMLPQLPSFAFASLPLSRFKRFGTILMHLYCSILADRVVQCLMQKMAAEVAYWQSKVLWHKNLHSFHFCVAQNFMCSHLLVLFLATAAMRQVDQL